MRSGRPGRRRPTLRAAAALALAAATGTASPVQPAAAIIALCDGCHGRDGNSTTALVPSLAAQPRLFLETQLVLVREGLRDIPVMRDLMKQLSDNDIQALAGHYAAQRAAVAPPPGPLQEDRFRSGEQLAKRALCGTCHLPNYLGQQQVPRLAAQDEAYLLYAMKQLRDNPGPGRDTIMAASLYGLGNNQLAELAHYFAHLRP